MTDNEKEIVIEYLDALPDVAQLCHGDYHPDNVLVSSKGAVIIDWTTAVSGNPLADVARTAMILKYAALPDEMPKLTRYLFHRIRPLLYKNYLNTYIKISGNQLEEIKRWELPIMAARLIEGVPKEEKKTLCSKIREKISR